MLGDMGDMGDILCTTAQCDTGQAQVQQMDFVFQSADPVIQAQFQTAHDSIMTSFNASWSFLSDMIPFNPNCCNIATIGTQALALMNQIQVAMGQAPTPGGTPGGVSTTSLLVIVGAVAIGWAVMKGKIRI